MVSRGCVKAYAIHRWAGRHNPAAMAAAGCVEPVDLLLNNAERGVSGRLWEAPGLVTRRA
jgi:hypothetical protein